MCIRDRRGGDGGIGNRLIGRSLCNARAIEAQHVSAMHLSQPMRRGRQHKALHQFGAVAFHRGRIVTIGCNAIAKVEMIERRKRPACPCLLYTSRCV